MAEIIGYGEDALTIWALLNEDVIKMILVKAGVKKNKSHDRQIPKMKIFYRPSFGRNEKCLGECDAIIGTDTKIFFVECKWTKSKENTSLGIKLDKGQIERNKMLIKYSKMYFENPEDAKKQIMSDKGIKGEKTQLWDSFNYVLSKLKNDIGRVALQKQDTFRSLLVVFTDKSNIKNKKTNPVDGFTTIHIDLARAAKMHKSNFYAISESVNSFL